MKFSRKTNWPSLKSLKLKILKISDIFDRNSSKTVKTQIKSQPLKMGEKQTMFYSIYVKIQTESKNEHS